MGKEGLSLCSRPTFCFQHLFQFGAEFVSLKSTINLRGKCRGTDVLNTVAIASKITCGSHIKDQMDPRCSSVLAVVMRSGGGIDPQWGSRDSPKESKVS